MQFISAVIESLAQVNHILTVIKRVDSTLGSRMSRDNLLTVSNRGAPNQLPGALARIVSSASIYARTPTGTQSPFPESEDNANGLIPKLNDLYKSRSNVNRR